MKYPAIIASRNSDPRLKRRRKRPVVKRRMLTGRRQKLRKALKKPAVRRRRKTKR